MMKILIIVMLFTNISAQAVDRAQLVDLAMATGLTCSSCMLWRKAIQITHIKPMICFVDSELRLAAFQLNPSVLQRTERKIVKSTLFFALVNSIAAAGYVYKVWSNLKHRSDDVQKAEKIK